MWGLGEFSCTRWWVRGFEGMRADLMGVVIRGGRVRMFCCLIGEGARMRRRILCVRVGFMRGGVLGIGSNLLVSISCLEDRQPRYYC